MDKLKNCPNCGGVPKLHKRRSKFYYECDGDCWTRTHTHLNASEAAKEWNSLKKERGIER